MKFLISEKHAYLCTVKQNSITFRIYMMNYREEQNHVKKQIISLLKSTNRKGIQHLIGSLLSSDFFTARCHSHHTYRGGLAKHVLGVCELMLKEHPELDRSSVILVGLMHDVCKAYKHSWQACGLKMNGHHGHGSRSTAILRHCGVELTHEESEAIACHMHKVSNGNLLWKAVRKADHEDASRCPDGYRPYGITIPEAKDAELPSFDCSASSFAKILLSQLGMEVVSSESGEAMTEEEFAAFLENGDK